jgi:hypothetical protein
MESVDVKTDTYQSTDQMHQYNVEMPFCNFCMTEIPLFHEISLI